MWIIYAEDDIEDFNFLCEIVKSRNSSIDIMNTRNGAETLEFLENAVVLPDLIFMDINMPAMDGKACLREIKKDIRFKDLPIVVYTTSRDPKDKLQCLQLGATDYVEKPHSVKAAYEVLGKFIPLEKVAVR